MAKSNTDLIYLIYLFIYLYNIYSCNKINIIIQNLVYKKIYFLFENKIEIIIFKSICIKYN